MGIGKERRVLREELRKAEHMRNRITKQTDGMLDKVMSLDEVIGNLKAKLDVPDGNWERRKPIRDVTFFGKLARFFKVGTHANL